jgi:alpha-2-macroglobulin
MTAYMIQSLVLRGRAGDAVDSVKWLGKQRNSRGGFVSTQDTVVALQALSMYSQNITSIPLDMTVTVSHSSPTEVEDARELGVFSMEETDKLLLRRQTVSDLPSKLTVETKGSGCAMVQTVLRYNTPEAPENSGFTLTAAQAGSDLNVCGQYTGSQSKTGMVVMEVEMVSGWEARFSEIESLVNDVNYEIQRVERGKEDKDNVVLYFDSWPRDELCVTLPLKQDTIINEVKPAVVSLYDYYNTDDKATVLYSLK